MLKLLLAHGVSINASDFAGRTPLYYSARDGSLDAAASLLRFGADPHIASRDGLTPLNVAERLADKEMILLLTNAMRKP